MIPNPDYTGYTENEARETAATDGLHVRITRLDNNYPAITRDIRTDRVNLEIVNNRVTKSYLG